MKKIYSKIEVNKAINKITDYIYNIKEDLCLLPILNGGFYLWMKLSISLYKKYGTIYRSCFLNSFSYGNNACSVKDPEIFCADISNIESSSTIVIIDDIIDSGRTMKKVINFVREIGNKEIYITSLLLRRFENNIKENSFSPIIIEDNAFIVGSGMGLGEQYRDLEGLYELEQSDIS